MTTHETMLNSYKISNCPNTAFYIPNFLSKEEEVYLLDRVNGVPKPKWTQLAHRRLQNWGGCPHPNGMIAEPIPQWLQTCLDKVAQVGMFGEKKPNHVLINEYKPKEGIMPHVDGPMYYPTIATISLGSHTILNYYKVGDDTNEVKFSLYLQPRSLLVQQHDMYTSYLHGIQEVEEDFVDEKVANLSAVETSVQPIKRGTRVSLTIRHVLKTTKLKINLGW